MVFSSPPESALAATGIQERPGYQHVDNRLSARIMCLRTQTTASAADTPTSDFYVPSAHCNEAGLVTPPINITTNVAGR
ncbi:hypothetical protein AB1N83_012092 [Pleurotus pulmonarius]